MNILKKIIRVLINTLMILTIVVGISFLVLYLIGIEPYVVLSGSMEPAIQTGSVSFINKHVSYEEIQEGDIIAFKSGQDTKVTHRVVNITEEGMETKGDANSNSDGIKTTKENYIGKNIFGIPKLGYAIKVIQSTRGKIVLGTMIVVLLLSAILIGEPKKSKHSTEEN